MSSELREEALESRWEAAPVVALVIALQVLLAMISLEQGWDLWSLPWWIWLIPAVPELCLLIALAWDRPRKRLEGRGLRREASLALIGLVSLANGLAVVALIGSIASAHETSGRQLLLKGIVVWTTNVIAFGLWFWELDGGGPVRRQEADPPTPDWDFPSKEKVAHWRSHLIDYLYVSFTNSIAFSPTDAMPLTRRAKVLMLIEASTSSLTVLLVAARAVNILK